MPRPAFSAAPSASLRKGWHRLAVLAAGAVTAAGALVAIAAPATAALTGSASATGLSGSSISSQASDFVQDCRGPYGGSGGRSCEEPTVTPAHATSVTVQDCRGPFSGSGGVTSCAEPTTRVSAA